jgi:hypothetical protein
MRRSPGSGSNSLVGGGGCEIRTREGLPPTRFPSVRPRPLGESSAGQPTDCSHRSSPRPGGPLCAVIHDRGPLGRLEACQEVSASRGGRRAAQRVEFSVSFRGPVRQQQQGARSFETRPGALPPMPSPARAAAAWSCRPWCSATRQSANAAKTAMFLLFARRQAQRRGHARCARWRCRHAGRGRGRRRRRPAPSSGPAEPRSAAMPPTGLRPQRSPYRNCLARPAQ